MNRKRNSQGKCSKEEDLQNSKNWIIVVLILLANIPWIYALIRVGLFHKLQLYANELFSCTSPIEEVTKKNGW